MNKEKIRKLVPYIVCAIIALSIGIYFRLYPLTHFGSSESYEKATMIVLFRLRAQISKNILYQFPNIDNLERRTLINRAFDNSLSKESEKIKQSINKLSRELNDSSKNKKFPYLLGSDSFYYLGLTKNIIETGSLGSEIKGSKFLNKRMMAPNGHWTPITFHPYLGYLTHRVFKAFNKNIDLMTSVSFVPLIIFSIAMLFFIGLSKQLGCSAISVIGGSMMFCLAPVFVKRSALGWYDNDPYNVLFPLAILFFFFKGLDKNLDRTKIIIYGLVCAALFGLYAFFWQGWVYFFCIIMASALGIFIYNKYFAKEKPPIKNTALYSSVILFATILCITISFGAKDLFVLFSEGWQALTSFLEPKLSSWPDVFIGVGELKRITFPEITELSGGLIFLCFFILGFGVFGFECFFCNSKKYDPQKFICLFLFLVFSIFISLGALRFAIFSLIPMAIFIPVGLDRLYKLANKQIMKRIHSPSAQKIIAYSGLAISIFIISIVPVRNAHTAITQFRPIFNDVWNSVLVNIKENTPKNSIVNTWWSPGHFISSVARRRTTFDGATINTPQAYWISNFFLSNDENHAVGLLRMLNNSGNKAVEFLENSQLNMASPSDKQKYPLALIIEKLHKIAKLNKAESRKILKNFISDDKITLLLKLTHQKPPPSYVLVYSELIEKNLQLSFLGQWNFETIENIRNNPSALKALPPRNTKEYISFLWKTVGGPLNYSEIIPALNRKDNVLFFKNNITIDLNDMTCRINSDKFGKGIPYSIVYLKNGNIAEKKLANSNLGFTVLLFKHQKLFHCIILDPRLAKSMLMRLYFFEGKGLKHIKPFMKKTDLTGRTRIYVYKVDWESFWKDIGEN